MFLKTMGDPYDQDFTLLGFMLGPLFMEPTIM